MSVYADFEKMPKTLYASTIIGYLIDKMKEDGDYQVSMELFERMVMGEQGEVIPATIDTVAKARSEGLRCATEHNAPPEWNPYQEGTEEYIGWLEGWGMAESNQVKNDDE